jgi:hypothetical protein
MMEARLMLRDDSIVCWRRLWERGERIQVTSRMEDKIEIVAGLGEVHVEGSGLEF